METDFFICNANTNLNFSLPGQDLSFDFFDLPEYFSQLNDLKYINDMQYIHVAPSYEELHVKNIIETLELNPNNHLYTRDPITADNIANNIRKFVRDIYTEFSKQCDEVYSFAVSFMGSEHANKDYPGWHVDESPNIIEKEYKSCFNVSSVHSYTIIAPLNGPTTVFYKNPVHVTHPLNIDAQIQKIQVADAIFMPKGYASIFNLRYAIHGFPPVNMSNRMILTVDMQCMKPYCVSDVDAVCINYDLS